MTNASIGQENVEKDKTFSQQITSEELMIHQEPIAIAMKTMISILNYERRILPTDIFNALVESLKQNIIKSLDNIKLLTIESENETMADNSVSEENII